MPTTLTYALFPANTIDYIDQQEILAAFERALSRYSLIVPITFVHATNYNDVAVKVACYKGAHEQCKAFEENILAHTFYPKDGRIHMNADKRWTIDIGTENPVGIPSYHMESVFMHEIGHVLGLEHSRNKDAIMYKFSNAWTKKVELMKDDVKTIQALYGSNPNRK